jgi:hypothetical protein
MVEVRIRRKELVAPGPVVPQLVTSAKHKIVVSWQKFGKIIEFHDALFRTNSAVVMPAAEGPSSESGGARRRTAVGIAATCLRYAEEHASENIIVAGHADTMGTNKVNDKLSDFRAGCVTAVLTGDAEKFAKICATWERMRVSDYKQILKWIAETFGFDCDPGVIDDHHTGTTQKALNNFRKQYNTDGPGATRGPKTPEFGDATLKETWIAYFQMYEDALAEELGEEFEALAGLRANLQFVLPDRFVGCGEHHPKEAENVDEFESQTNRRVEVLFFEPTEQPETICHPGPKECKPEECEIYDPTRFVLRVLPPMLSAKPWRATWDFTTAKMGDVRNLLLAAPGLPAGTPIVFEVSQVGFGPVAELTGTAVADAATVEFGDWFHAPAVQFANMGPGQKFPVVQFTFTAKGGGREVVAKIPLTYADRLDVVVQADDGTVLAEHPYVLLSPWGVRKGAKTDADGRVVEEGIPPGGVNLLVDETTIVDFDKIAK